MARASPLTRIPLEHAASSSATEEALQKMSNIAAAASDADRVPRAAGGGAPPRALLERA